MRRWVVGTICSITLIFVSLASMIQFSNGWTLGDYIFKFLNQTPWSNGSSGIHYSAIDSLLFELNPGEARTFEIEAYADNSSGLHMSGSMSTPRLVLFNEQDEKTFAR